MELEVVVHPRDLKPGHIGGRAVVVFDVLRATTTMTAALAAGAKEIRAFDSVEAARSAAAAFAGEKLLCGELGALPPAGFDLGNSPGDYTPDRVAGRTIFFATTNGTRAINAAISFEVKPGLLLAAALVNARPVARKLAEAGLDITLLCSGSEGLFSAEDFLGAGAVATELAEIHPIESIADTAIAAKWAIAAAKADLPAALRQTFGGHNNLRVGLAKDIDFCARLNVLEAVGVITGTPPTATAL
jgi:2-phosphosulfolactate phosphatase